MSVWMRVEEQDDDGDGDNVTAGSATGSVSRRRVLLQLLAM